LLFDIVKTVLGRKRQRSNGGPFPYFGAPMENAMDEVTKPTAAAKLPPDLGKLEIHKLAKLVPEASPEEFKTLKESIRLNDIREPIVIFEGMILDGRHRYRAALELGYRLKPSDFRVFEGTHEQAKAFVEDVNLARRQLTIDQKSEVARRMISENPTATNRVIARKCGLSHVTIGKLKKEASDAGKVDGKYEKFARYWKSLDDQQQERFVAQFRIDLRELLQDVERISRS
jgi:ParB-like nuclease domain